MKTIELTEEEIDLLIDSIKGEIADIQSYPHSAAELVEYQSLLQKLETV